MMWRTYPKLFLLLLFVGTFPAGAYAEGDFALQRFRPKLHAYGGFGVEAARLPEDMLLNAYIMTNVSGSNLQDRRGKEQVPLMGAVDLLVSASFLGFLSVGLDLPVHFGTGTYLDGEEMSKGSMGDMRFSLKATSLMGEKTGIGFGGMVDLIVPTASPRGYAGEAKPSFRTMLLLDAMMDKAHVMTNFWLLVRGDSISPNFTDSPLQLGRHFVLENELGMSFSSAFFLGSRAFQLILEGRLESKLERFLDSDLTQLEFDLGFLWRHEDGFSMGLGAGTGVMGGFGDPSWRAFLSIGYQPVRRAPLEEEKGRKQGKEPGQAPSEGGGKGG